MHTINKNDLIPFVFRKSQLVNSILPQMHDLCKIHQLFALLVSSL